MPTKTNDNGVEIFNENAPDGLPYSLYEKLGQIAKLPYAISQLRIISPQTISLYCASVNKTVSSKTITVFLLSYVNAGLLVEVNDPNLGIIYQKTAAYKKLHPNEGNTLEAQAKSLGLK